MLDGVTAVQSGVHVFTAALVEQLDVLPAAKAYIWAFHEPT
jgi:hypothetical protein